MRVLLIAENWPPRVGGIEDYLTHVAFGLPRGSVTVVAPFQRGVEPHSTDGGVIVNRRRMFWPLIRPAWLPLFVNLFRAVKREPADIVLCGKALFEGHIGYYLKRWLGIPYIVFTYAMEIETWANGRQRRALQRVLKAADRVAYINDETAATLRRLGVTDKQLVKIWPGVDEKFFETPDKVEDTLQRYEINQPYILSVGRLVERKGFDTLIEAFASLDQARAGAVQLVIVGEGPDRHRLEKLAEGQAGIHLLGSVRTDDLRRLYAGAAVFALTPRRVGDDYEGFGIVYLEAAGAGVPAVATRSGGAGEAIVNQETGLVVQADARAVRDALARLLDDSALRDKLGARAKKRAWDQFRWGKRILLVKGMIDAVMMEREGGRQKEAY